MPRVRAGFFSFTEITGDAGIDDPGAGDSKTAAARHRAYNAWHLLDHMPEQFGIPGIALGQRWVLTPAAAERAVLGPPLERIHYVTLYLMTDPLDATLDEFSRFGAELFRTEGRGFADRRAPVAGPWLVDAMAVAPRALVRAEVVPARPHRAVQIVVGGALDLDAACRRPGVAGAWTFVPAPELAARRRGDLDVPIHVLWCDSEPESVAIDPDPDVTFAAVLEPVSPWNWEWTWFDP